MKRFLSFDIGGTSAKYAIVEDSGLLQPLGSFPTGSGMSRSELEQALLRAIRTAPLPCPDGIGISTLGAVDPTDGHIIGAVENMPCVEGFDPAGVLHAVMPQTPVSVINDATAAALGEHWCGAAKGFSSFVCVVFGTGVGSCIVLNGRPLDGMHHLAGEIGYWNYENPGSYWELSASAQALFAEARRLTGDHSLSGPLFFERLEQKDPVCTALFQCWCASVGRVFSNLVLMLDMERIVIGGGISAQGARLTAPLQQAMDALLPDYFHGCQVVPARLGNHAALLGAVRPLL